METVPTSTGWPFACLPTMSSTTALNLARSVLKTMSGRSCRIMGLAVGICTTGMPYILMNSASSVAAVPVMPASFEYILK